MTTPLPPDSELLRLQTDFTRHLRNPDLAPIPAGLNARRVGIYSELIFHNISALMSEFFPVLHRMLNAEDWDALIREFFISHRAQTPYFPRLAEEFLQFLMARPGTNHEPEYLLPLAHYEWLELYLFTLEAELPAQPLPPSTLGTTPLRLSELAIPVAYEFPVHQIKPGWEESRQPVFLLVFRDRDDSVRFFELQPLAYEMLSAMQHDSEEASNSGAGLDTGLDAVAWLKSKAAELQQPETGFVTLGLDLIKQFNRENLLLNTGTTPG